jgi:flagellar biosynthesis GTPase FlhF
VQFSFEDGFKETLFSMMNELKEMLNEGGTPVFTTYAVEIGDALWCALHEHIVNAYPAEECEFCSQYRIEGIYEEGGQKFAILHDAPKDVYYRLDFSVGEEGYAFNADLITVEKEFVPVSETPQFNPETYSEYETTYAANKKAAKKDEEEDEKKDEEEEKCPKCGKPLSECDCEEEDEDEDKKKKYVLEEIPEYMQLSDSYNELENKYSALEAANSELTSANETLASEKASLEAELATLKEFKLGVERKEKEVMINETFYMLSDDIKKEVMENIDTYSLDDIEAKLSVLCVRNKISFSEEIPAPAPTTYGIAGFDAEDDSIPAWVKAVLETQKNM